MTPSDVSSEALTWLGTPFRWQGRSRMGLDCGGLAGVVGEALGLLQKPLEPPKYRPPMSHGFLLTELRKYLRERPVRVLGRGCSGDSIQCCSECKSELAGTVIVIGIRRDHCGIALDDGRLVWVNEAAGCHAIEITPDILSQTRHVFEFPGVSY